MKEVTEEYATLFNAITDALNVIEDLENRLRIAQLAVEEMYISKE